MSTANPPEFPREFSRPRFVLFDLDGTLVHSVSLLFGAYRAWLAMLNIDPDRLRPDQLNGLATEEIIDIVHRRFLPAHDRSAIADHYFARIADAYRRAEPAEGADELLKQLKADRIALGTVTSAKRELADIVIGRFGWHRHLDVISAGQAGKPSKPHPWPYQWALEQLGMSPGEGWAIEDSTLGVQSAARAGVRVVGYAPEDSGNVLISAGASAVIHRLGRLTRLCQF